MLDLDPDLDLSLDPGLAEHYGISIWQYGRTFPFTIGFPRLSLALVNCQKRINSHMQK